MRFSDFQQAEEPGYEIFSVAIGVIFDKNDPGREHMDRLSDEARLVYLLRYFDGEIQNGGFDQLLKNRLGNHCAEILHGLATVGAGHAHALLAEVMAFFPESHPARDRQLRWEQTQNVSDPQKFQDRLGELDTKFYACEDNLSELIEQYVRSHPSATIMRPG
jgi:hypothetical protein